MKNKTPLGYIELPTGPKAIFPMNDIFLNFTFENPIYWEALRLIVNIIIEAYKQAVTDTLLKPVTGTIEVKTQFKHFLDDGKTTRDQDLKMIEDKGNLTFIECQNKAITVPPIPIRSVEYFGLGIGHSRGKLANQIWLLAEDVDAVLQGKTFAHYILKDEETGHTHPSTSGILYVSMDKLSQENTPAGELAAILLGKEKSTEDKNVGRVIQALNASFDNFKSDKEVAFVYSLQERWANEARIEGIAEGKVKGVLEFALKLIKRNRPIDEIVEDSGLSREYIESLMNES